jgi:hypothetical protein
MVHSTQPTEPANFQRALRVRNAANQMLAALKFALPYMEDLASSSDNKGERRAARLMRQAIRKAQESEP